MSTYERMTNEEFDTILKDIVDELDIDQLFALPGFYEIVREEFNNEVLSEWERQNSEPEEAPLEDEVEESDEEDETGEGFVNFWRFYHGG